MSKWSKFPVSLPGGGISPQLSARLRTETIDALFVASGGFERALAWVEASDENYAEFFKMWAKGAVRAVSSELNVSEGVEALLEKLDREDSMRTINGTADVVDVEPGES